jgi:16S rRNA G966 N2-methylase RsmD
LLNVIVFIDVPILQKYWPVIKKFLILKRGAMHMKKMYMLVQMSATMFCITQDDVWGLLRLYSTGITKRSINELNFKAGNQFVPDAVAPYCEWSMTNIACSATW